MTRAPLPACLVIVAVAVATPAVAQVGGPLLLSGNGMTRSADYPSLQPMPVQNAYGLGRPDIAQTPIPVSARNSAPGPLGGGFIEFLFTGRTDGGENGYGSVPRPNSARPWVPAEPREPAAARAAEPPRREPDARFQRQLVDYGGPHRAGTIVIDTNQRLLFLVQGDGKAMRYGVGVGRPGFEWHGTHTISSKREWPDWRPPKEMLKRRPDLPTYMAGGPANPLGARAMYLGSSMYRIHGSNEPETIGQAVSSGCIRMRNDDVVDLYDRVKVGTKVIVL